MYIDTHTHIYDEAFDNDREEAFQRSITEGVTKLIFPAIDSTYYTRMASYAASHKENIFMGMGLHPTSVAANWKEEIEFVEKHLMGDCAQNIDNEKFIAIGEIGLDFYWSKEFASEQKEALEAQLDMALKLQLPVILHIRQAQEEIFDILQGRFAALRGVFHAFTGSLETYLRIKKLGGFKVGIGGVVTFKKAGIADVVKDIPLEDIVLETDSPWLTPVPHRGERNESSYIPLIASKIAQVKNIDIEQVAAVTTQNAEQLFSI